MNHQIRAKEVRLIGYEGKQVGVVDIKDAQRQAEDQGLDLLLVTQDANPPVCKIVDIGQYKYEERKKEKQARKGSRQQVVKELKMSPKISDHDYQVRLTQAKKFLDKLYTVKLSIFFKGRAITRKELGVEVIKRFIEDIKEVGTPTSQISSAHRSLCIMFGPGKNNRSKENEKEVQTKS